MQFVQNNSPSEKCGSYKDSFPLIYEYWTRYVVGTASPPNPQHKLMAKHMRGSIEAALLEFDPSVTIEEAEALA